MIGLKVNISPHKQREPDLFMTILFFYFFLCKVNSCYFSSGPWHQQVPIQLNFYLQCTPLHGLTKMISQ